MLNTLLGVEMKYNRLPVRPGDQKIFVADTSKIQAKIGWKPQVTTQTGIENMISWIKDNQK
jgi:UDP-glucose 4-epimerase